ncbi:MAG: sulfatase [Actinomycetota bacterium]
MRNWRALSIVLGLACAAVFGASSPSAAGVPSQAKQPNIVMIISDDHAWTDYGFMGHPQIRTPRLDRLASQSLTFTRGYVPSSLCCPSLASIISGLYAHQHKVTSNDPPRPANVKPAEFYRSEAFLQGRETMNRYMDAAPALPRILGASGYLSMQTGKWWQGDFRRGGFTHGMTQGGRHGDEGLKIGRETMQPVVDFIGTAQHKKKPFFLWYAPMMPHTPHNPPERFLAKYRDKAPTLPVAKYWAMCEWFDETCGQLLDQLEKSGVADNTIVVYVADNGWLQEPNADRYAERSKQSPYEGGLRTPIMIRWPGKVRPRRSNDFAMSIDLAPTLLRAVGLKPASGMQGVNLLDERARGKRKTIYGECFTHNAVDLNRPASSLRWRWAIDGDWKLVLPAAQNEPDGKPELYQVSSDPQEKMNLAASDPKRVERMTRLINGWWDGR